MHQLGTMTRYWSRRAEREWSRSWWHRHMREEGSKRRGGRGFVPSVEERKHRSFWLRGLNKWKTIVLVLFHSFRVEVSFVIVLFCYWLFVYLRSHATWFHKIVNKVNVLCWRYPNPEEKTDENSGRGKWGIIKYEDLICSALEVRGGE